MLRNLHFCAPRCTDAVQGHGKLYPPSGLQARFPHDVWTLRHDELLEVGPLLRRGWRSILRRDVENVLEIVGFKVEAADAELLDAFTQYQQPGP